MNTTFDSFESFFDAFLECAIWTKQTSEGEPMDIATIDQACLEILKAHALSFWSRMWYYIDLEDPCASDMVAQAGHDFWLTSQGHGAGFWDGGWPKYGDMLTKLSKCYPAEIEIKGRW